jgi:hypothetical protein
VTIFLDVLPLAGSFIVLAFYVRLYRVYRRRDPDTQQRWRQRFWFGLGAYIAVAMFVGGVISLVVALA